MKKMRKLTAMIASIAVVLALGSGTAMAAEVGNEIGDTQAEYLLDEGGDELNWLTDLDGDGIPDKLKEVNPHITDEVWEMYKIIKNAEENGLIEVGETTIVDGDVTIVQKSFSKAITPYGGYTGQDRFYTHANIYYNNQLVWGTLLGADIAWNSDPNVRTAEVVPGSVFGDDMYSPNKPSYIEKVTAYKNSRDNVVYNFEKCAYVYYGLILDIGKAQEKTYLTEMKVNCYGVQVVGRDPEIFY